MHTSLQEEPLASPKPPLNEQMILTLPSLPPYPLVGESTVSELHVDRCLNKTETRKRILCDCSQARAETTTASSGHVAGPLPLRLLCELSHRRFGD